MRVPIIKAVEELKNVTPFQVENLLWGTKAIPKTYVYLGFIPGDGFRLRMICEEKNPLRTFTNEQEPVYRDSALEAFFQFEPGRTGNSSEIYLNFEVNANGALLAAYGRERTYRTYFEKGDMKAFECKALVEEEQWSVELRIPINVLEKIYGELHLGAGSIFRCNFYKISESVDIEHYASYAPIRSEVPSFHLPEFFATAEIVEG